AVVHIGGDALAVDDAQLRRGQAQLDGRGRIETPPHLAAGRLIVDGAARFVADLAQDAGQPDVAPVAAIADRRGQIWQLFIGLDVRRDVFVEQTDVPRVDVVARMLERDRRGPRTVIEESPADLRVAQPDHPGRAPIFDRVGPDVAIHEQGVGLAGQERAPARVDMPYMEGRLAFVRAGAEQVELELGLIGLAGKRSAGLGSQPALPNAEDRLPVASELAVGRWNSRRP